MNIITALNNPNLNKKLKENKEFNIIGNDIQYQEGIFEMMEKNRTIDILIISELLPGELDFKDLINKIVKKHLETTLIVFLQENNEETKNFLIAKGIFDIFLNNEITIEKIKEIINKKNNNKKEIEINEEIKELKKIILEKNNKKNKIFLKIKNNKTIKIIKNKIIKNKLNNKNNKKIISIIGTPGVGKSSFCTILSLLLNNKKILIMDFDILNSSINSIFNIKKNKTQKTEKNDNFKMENLIIKFNKSIDLCCATKILVDGNYKKLKENIVNEMCGLKNKYDIIIIDNSSECFFEYTRQLLNISDQIIFLSEPNLIELKKSKNLLNIYLNKWKIKKEKINIIFNKINKNSIDDKILKILFSDFNILGKIKININYNLIINKNIKLIDKKIKNDYLKIIEKINL